MNRLTLRPVLLLAATAALLFTSACEPSSDPSPSTTAPAAVVTTIAPAPSTTAPAAVVASPAKPLAVVPTPPSTTAPPAAPVVHYKNCKDAKAAGAAPLHKNDPGYDTNLDRDGDGVARE